MNKSTAINIGKIVATHGIKGWVVIKSYSYPTHNIKNYDTFLYIKNRKEFIEIVNLKIMPKKIIIRMKDYDDINSSEPLVGQDLFIEASDIPALKKGAMIQLVTLLGLSISKSHGISYLRMLLLIS